MENNFVRQDGGANVNGDITRNPYGEWKQVMASVNGIRLATQQQLIIVDDDLVTHSPVLSTVLYGDGIKLEVLTDDQGRPKLSVYQQQLNGRWLKTEQLSDAIQGRCNSIFSQMGFRMEELPRFSSK